MDYPQPSTRDSLIITAERVPEHARIRTLPRHFGYRMLEAENAIYDTMGRLAPKYRGGYWLFYELSNGGFYMAPDVDDLRLCVPENGFEDSMTADAAGITACLFVFSELSFSQHGEAFGRHYHWLRDFALDHQDSGKILGAID